MLYLNTALYICIGIVELSVSWILDLELKGGLMGAPGKYSLNSDDFDFRMAFRDMVSEYLVSLQLPYRVVRLESSFFEESQKIVFMKLVIINTS